MLQDIVDSSEWKLFPQFTWYHIDSQTLILTPESKVSKPIAAVTGQESTMSLTLFSYVNKWHDSAE